MSEKTYINGMFVTEKEGKFGKFFNVSINVDKLIEDLQKFKNEKGYVNLTMSARKEVGKYGDTHSVTLNDFVPKATETAGNSSDLPF